MHPSHAAELWPLSALLAEPCGAQVSVIRCGHHVDVINGKVLGATTVIVEGEAYPREVITQGTASGVPARRNAAQVDLSSQTCLPGLIDSHTSPERLSVRADDLLRCFSLEHRRIT